MKTPLPLYSYHHHSCSDVNQSHYDIPTEYSIHSVLVEESRCSTVGVGISNVLPTVPSFFIFGFEKRSLIATYMREKKGIIIIIIIIRR